MVFKAVEIDVGGGESAVVDYELHLSPNSVSIRIRYPDGNLITHDYPSSLPTNEYHAMEYVESIVRVWHEAGD